MKESRKSLLVKFIIKTRLVKRWVQNKLIEFSLPEYTTFTLFSVLIGIAAGLSAVLFHNSIEFFNHLFFEQTKEGLFFLGGAAVIAIPAIGMLLQSLMIYSSPQIAKRKGVSEVIKAVALRGGYIQLRTTLFHFLAPVICIGSGNTVGPEGPAAQIGGGVASKFSSFFSLSDERIRIFTAAGAGAAIAAIFNTPLGGVFFTLEIILLNDFHAPTFSALILASVTASAISRILLGNDAIFIFNAVESINYSHLYLYGLLGLFAGIVSILFIKYSNSIQHLFNKKIYARSFPKWTGMLIAGLLVGVSGYLFPQLFGIGYQAINELLSSELSWKTAAIILALKFLLVPLVLYSGGFGGIFAPSLFMGACSGFLFSNAVNTIWNLNVDPTTMILVGMGAALGGINSIPISAILIIFEMTQDYTYILPLMLAVIISSMLVQIALRGSIHLKHLEAEGFRISEGKETNILRKVKVKDVNLRKIIIASENAPLSQIMEMLLNSSTSSIFIRNSDSKIIGIISEAELRPITTEYEMLKDVLVAKDLLNPNIQILNLNDDLDYVLNLFGKFNVEQFPVVDLDTDQFIGTVTRQQVLEIYNRESIKVNLASGLAKELKTLGASNQAEVIPGHSIKEIISPVIFEGKNLSEIKLRSNYQVEVLMIKKRKDALSNKEVIITPDPNYKLKAGDILLIFGEDEKLAEFERKIK